MNLKQILLIATVSCTVGATTVSAIDMPFSNDTQSRTISIAMTGGYPPWNKSEKDKFVGFEPEMLEIVCRRMERNCELKQQSYQSLAESIRFKKFDLGVSGLTVSSNTGRVFITSSPYAENYVVFVSKKGGDFDKDFCPEEKKCPSVINLGDIDAKKQMVIDALLAALKGKVLAVTRRTSTLAFTRTKPDWFVDTKVQPYTNTEDAVQDMLDGKVDVVASYDAFLNMIIPSDAKDQVAFSRVRFSGGGFGEYVAAIATKRNQTLIDEFNAAIKSMKDDGTLSALSEKWFGEDIVPD